MSKSPPTIKHAPWRAVSAMFVLNGALFGIWASRIPAVAERHDLGPGALGLLLLLLAGGAIVAFPLAGRGADRFGAAKVTWRISIFYTAALILIALAPNVAALATALFLFGMMHGAMDVSMNTWAGEVEKRLGRPVMSSFHAMFSLGAGAGAGTGFLAASAGLDLPAHFGTAGIVLALITLPIANIGWESDKRRRAAGAPVFSMPKSALLAVGFLSLCATLGEGAMADWSAIFLVKITDASEANAALGYTVFSIAMVVMRLLGDRAIQHFGPVNSARLAGLSASAGAVCAVAFATYPMALVGFALMGIGYAVIMPLAFSRAANDPDVPPGQAIASVSALAYGGMLLGPPLIGFVAEATSLRIAFFILSLLALLIVGLSGVLKRGGGAAGEAAAKSAA